MGLGSHYDLSELTKAGRGAGGGEGKVLSLPLPGNCIQSKVLFISLAGSRAEGGEEQQLRDQTDPGSQAGAAGPAGECALRAAPMAGLRAAGLGLSLWAAVPALRSLGQSFITIISAPFFFVRAVGRR